MRDESCVVSAYVYVRRVNGIQQYCTRKLNDMVFFKAFSVVCVCVPPSRIAKISVSFNSLLRNRKKEAISGFPFFSDRHSHSFMLAFGLASFSQFERNLTHLCGAQKT